MKKNYTTQRDPQREKSNMKIKLWKMVKKIIKKRKIIFELIKCMRWKTCKKMKKKNKCNV